MAVAGNAFQRERQFRDFAGGEARPVGDQRARQPRTEAPGGDGRRGAEQVARGALVSGVHRRSPDRFDIRLFHDYGSGGPAYRIARSFRTSRWNSGAGTSLPRCRRGEQG
ncbi:hypothetical protein ACFSKM_08940 [Ancylobacter dichloromethanicus]